MMKYNKKKHFDLVKYKKKLELEGKDLYDISEKNFFELRHYLIMQIDYMQWASREHYFELIQEFLKEGMTFVKLIQKSEAINTEAERLESEFILFEPDPKSEGFGNLIDDLTGLFNEYSSRLGEEDELSEKRMKELVEEIFLKMKSDYPLEES